MPIEQATPAGKGRVLVVDDNALNRRLLVALLAADGYTVAQATSGAEALAELHAKPCDVVLLDIVMPTSDGFEVLAQIRTDPQLAELPVIMVTGHHDVEWLAASIDRGADDCLTKPIHATVLRARVRACVERICARRRERDLMDALRNEHARAEVLLGHILPPSIADRLKAHPGTIADVIPDATVVFVDLVGFTPLAARSTPAELVECLNLLFGGFDALAAALGVEKIKTIGDAYLAVSGVPEPRKDHVEAAVRFARAASQLAQGILGPDGSPLHVRIGVHCGPLVAGVVGTHKYAYDVWGDVVNTAARLQHACEPDGILLSDCVCRRLWNADCDFGAARLFDLKGKGRVSASYLLATP